MLGLKLFISSLFRHKGAAKANTLLLLYVTSIISLGVVLAVKTHLFNGFTHLFEIIIEVTQFIIATCLLAHGLILCAYFVHECLHNSIFKKPSLNRAVALPLIWLLGASYSRYATLQKKHIRHHSERRDVLSTDYLSILNGRRSLTRLVSWGQYWHLPAIDLLLHGYQIIRPFTQQAYTADKARVIWVLASRLLFFYIVGMISFPLLIALILATITCYGVLAFMDAYQHSYDVILDHSGANKNLTEHQQYIPDREFEETHTYSNLLSHAYPWLNLAVLNFCYHNVHHWKMAQPWFKLPSLHKERYSIQCAQTISLKQQLKYFHNNRIKRVSCPQTSSLSDYPVGGAGVSFLVGL